MEPAVVIRAKLCVPGGRLLVPGSRVGCQTWDSGLEVWLRGKANHCSALARLWIGASVLHARKQATVMLAPSGQRPEMLFNTSPCTSPCTPRSNYLSLEVRQS